MVVGGSGASSCSFFSCTGGGVPLLCGKNERPSAPLVASLSTEAIAEAFRSIEQSNQGKILNLDPPIIVNNDPGSGLEISAFKLDISSAAISGATFTMKNVSGKPMFAYSVVADLYWDTSEGKPCHWGITSDSWFLNGNILQPGEEKQIELTNSISPNMPSHLQKIVVNIDYAAYADGSVTGRNHEAVAAKLNESRRLQAEVQKRYSPLIASGTPMSSIENQLKSEIAAEKDPARRGALLRLQLALDGLGPEKFASAVLSAPAVPLK